jgi:hypothetical protein
VSTVLIIGAGDLGERLTAALAGARGVSRVVLAGRSSSTVHAITGTLSAASDGIVEPAVVDASNQDELAHLFASTRPDLVVQCASMRSPWALAGREDAAARTILAAGFALRLPYQLPIVLTVMRAARDAGYAGSVANLSYPDGTGPVLRTLGLAPTVGLGNAGMILRRVRSAVRASTGASEPPLVRVLAHHAQLPAAMESDEPPAERERCRVYLGEEGTRSDSLAYRGPPLATGIRLNAITCAAAVPVLEALLPGADPLRWSTPAPGGLPGGYPVRIADGAVELDLPPGLELADAVAYNERAGRGDAIERIDDDGTVHFTDACRQAVAALAPELAAPLAVADIADRAAFLDAVLG